MSGALERMLERARGQLPGVQPLVGPRFQPVASAPPFLEVDDERILNSAPSQSYPASPGSPPVGIAASKGPAQPQASNAQQAIADQNLESRLSALERRPAWELRETIGEHSVAGPARIEPAGPRPAPATPQFPQPRSGAAPPLPNSITTDSQATGQPTMAADPGRSALQKRRLEQTTPIQRSASALEGHEAPEVGQPAPEIHISIGAIELKAAKSEERPRAATFRPRVSLDDFLNRGQGGSA